MRGGRKSERLREREIDREREDWSGWRQQRLDQVGLGEEWSGLVVDGNQIGDRWWRLDQPVWWRARWSIACDQLSRSELNLYSSMHGWWLEMWVLGVCGSVMRRVGLRSSSVWCLWGVGWWSVTARSATLSKREKKSWGRKKKKAWPVRVLDGRGGAIWAGRSLVGRPPVLSLSLCLWVLEFIWR